MYLNTFQISNITETKLEFVWFRFACDQHEHVLDAYDDNYGYSYHGRMQLFMFAKLFSKCSYFEKAVADIKKTVMLCFKPDKYGRQDTWHIQYGMMNMAYSMHPYKGF